MFTSTTTAPAPRLSTLRTTLLTVLAALLAAALTLVPSTATAQPVGDPTRATTVVVPDYDTGAHQFPVAPATGHEPSPAIDYRANPWRQTAAKTWAFTQCIFGVGVPIGIAIVLATTPQFWSYVAGASPLPTWTHGAMKYGNTVKNRCRWAIFG